MNTYQEYCWNSRIVVYVSELPHYLRVPELLWHHLLILISMGAIAKWRGPHRGLDLALAALWAEIPESLRIVLRRSHYLDSHPRLDWHLAFWSPMIGFFTRAPTIILAMAMIPQSGLQGGPAFVAGSAYLFYLAYVFSLTYRRLKRAGILQFKDSGPFRLVFGHLFNINSTSLITGLEVLATQVSTLALYPWAQKDASHTHASELINITWNLVLAVVMAIAGSRLLVPHLQQVLHWSMLSSVYLHAGTLTAVSVLLLTPTLPLSVDRPTLVGCVILCSSLSKTASQLASRLVSAEQDLHSRASVVCGICNLGLLGAAGVRIILGNPVLDIAFKAALLQLLIQLAVDSRASESTKPRLRATTGLLTTLAILTALKVMGPLKVSAMAALHVSGIETNTTMEATSIDLLRLTKLPFTNAQTTVLGAVKEFFNLSVMYVFYYMLAGYAFCTQLALSPCGIKDIKRQVNCTTRSIAPVCLGLWACCIGYYVSRGEIPENQNRHREPHLILAAEPPFCTLVLSWQFWASISASVVVSTAAAHLLQPRKFSDAGKLSSCSS